MFSTRFKTRFSNPKKFYLDQDEKILDSAIIAVCFLFLQSLVSTAKLDTLQFIALVCFSIAIPLAGAHLFVLRAYPPRNVAVPVYLIAMYDFFTVIAMILAAFGVLDVLFRISWIASFAAIATIMYVFIVLRLIGMKKTRLELKENQKP